MSNSPELIQPAVADDPFVFISYRRSDTQTEAMLLNEKIRGEFGADRVFLDSREIDAGDRFPDEITSALEHATVMIVVIGPAWADALAIRQPDHARGRLDWVRQEICVALKRGLTILPVRFRTDRSLFRDALPGDISELADINQISVNEQDLVPGIEMVCRRLHELGFVSNLHAPPIPRLASAIPRPTRPYPVLEPYDHPALFSGREADVNALARELENTNICMTGESGRGKSSLLRAGLVPYLLGRGRPCAIESMPALPGLVPRLLSGLEVSPPKITDSDHSRFLDRLEAIRAKASAVPVLVLDQFEEVFRRDEGRALRWIGPLLAASSHDMPAGGPPCRWILSVRKDYHADVREWLHDVLREARREGVKKVDQLPSGLITRYTEWFLRPIAVSAADRNDFEQVKSIFKTIINKPLTLQHDGKPLFGFSFRSGDDDRLAEEFAKQRVKDPNAGLTIELQVVLSRLVDRARLDQGSVLAVEDDLPRLIDGAVFDHLSRKLEDAFPPVQRRPGTPHRRTQAILFLRHLLDANGQRNEGLTRDEIKSRLGDEWEEICERLGQSQTWLVVRSRVVDGMDRWRLPHDLLAAAVHALWSNEDLRRRFDLDMNAVQMHATVAHWVDLHRQDPKSIPDTKIMKKIRAAWPTLPKSAEWTEWWRTCEAFQRRNRLVRIAAAAVGAVTIAGAVGFVVLQINASRRKELLGVVEHGQPAEAFAAIRTLSNGGRDLPPDLPGFRSSAQRRATLFAEGGCAPDVAPRDVLLAIRLLAKSLAKERAVAGAMLSTLDAIEVDRAKDPAVRHEATQARQLLVRSLRLGDEPVNVIPEDEWITVGNGTMQMMKFEVTVDQYARFDPDPTKNVHASGAFAADRVSWSEARAFAEWAGARLPTTQEWIRTCEAGGASPSGEGWSPSHPDDSGSTSDTHPVGTLKANAWGFFDMLGNVAEWVVDRDEKEHYVRAKMGGDLGHEPDKGCRTRVDDGMLTAYSDTGVRLARDLKVATSP